MNKEKTAELHTSGLTEDLFLENEHNTNRMAVYCLLGYACLTFALGILGVQGLFNTVRYWSAGTLIMNGLIGFLLIDLVVFLGYSYPQVKKIIIGGIILLAATTYYLYPVTSVFLVFVPVLISIKYYDPEFTARTTFFTWLVYLFVMGANLLLDQLLPAFRSFHEDQGLLFWQDVPSVLIYYVGPRTLVYAFEGIIGRRIAQAGRTLVLKQAESSRNAAMMAAELSTAAELQKKALAEQDFRTPDGSMDVHAFIRPARDVGGDFYDYFMINDHLLVAAVADVSDKGLPSAMFGIEAQSYLRYALSEALTREKDGNVEFIDLKKAMDGVNRQLSDHNMDGMFVTMWIGCFDTRTGFGKYVNAGHSLPYLKRADGSLERIENDPQFFLGAFREAEYEARPFRIRHGETLFLYTDGVTDARNKQDETFGTQRLETILREIPAAEDGTGGCKLTEAVCGALEAHIGEGHPYDDITVLTLYRSGDMHSSKKTVQLAADGNCAEAAIDAVNAIIGPLGCPEFKRRNLDVAVDEICSNICEYAYGGNTGTVELEIHWGANYIAVRFTDSGIPFDPTAQENPDLSGEPEIGGLGIHLVRKLADMAEYVRRDGKNVFTVCMVWNM